MTDPQQTPPSDAPAPSLHIDSDWKAQAEAERARLAEKEAALQARAAEGGHPDRCVRACGATRHLRWGKYGHPR